MMSEVLLLLSTYPFITPRHGGQVRLFNIAKAYNDAGWKVESLAVYEPEGYEQKMVGCNDIPFPATSPYRKFKGRDVPLINDYLSGAFASADDGGFPSVLQKLPKQIKVIHVEQPWLWPLACKIKTYLKLDDTCLIYGSQNIEAPLKKEILENYDINDVNDVISEIDKLEKRAAIEADIAIAVTHSDLSILKSWGAKRLLLAHNGITPWNAKPEAVSRWKERLPKAPCILYIASAHPPNFTGFTRCVGESLGCIPPDSRLVVVGSVCNHIYDSLASTRWHSLNLSRLQLLGILSDDDLAAVKDLAHAFLLPIPHGGGSNIKAAEALYSGAYVIGTKAAFRGFESFIDMPEVTVAYSPSEFQMAIRNVLTSPRVECSKNQELRDELRWEKCLSSIPVAVEKLSKGLSPK